MAPLPHTLEMLQLGGAGVESEVWQALHEYFQDLALAVVRAQGGAGGWWQVMNWPGRERNFYEASATAMMTYALYKGVRMRYLTQDIGSYTAAALHGFDYMLNEFVVRERKGTLGFNGTVLVRGLDANFSYEVSIAWL